MAGEHARHSARDGRDACKRARRSERGEGDGDFLVRNLGGGVFSVEGRKVERMVIQTEWDNEEAIAYLQRRLEKMGVEKALTAAGACNGDEIRILNRSFALRSSISEPAAKVATDTTRLRRKAKR
jgi:Obg family GTPase CgtA-like protein